MDANNIGKKIIITKKDMVDEFECEVDDILNALGHPEALVTDESEIRDFLIADMFLKDMSHEDRNDIFKKEREMMEYVEKLVGREVEPNDNIAELARLAYMKKQEKKAKLRPH